MLYSEIPSDVFRQAGALISDDEPWHDSRQVIDGELRSTGLVSRDYEADPRFANAEEYPDELLMDEHDLKAAFEYQRAHKASLFDLRERSSGQLDSLDQDGEPLCWAFSSTKATMYCEAIAGHPIVKLSPWWVAGMIKGWRSQGGWGSASLHHIITKGAPKYDLCPRYKKPNDAQQQECLNDAVNRRIVRWWEASDSKDKAAHQMLSAFARGFPTVLDYNHMSHSMCGCRCASFESLDRFEVDCDNSWGMKSGVKGLYRLVNGKAKPDGLVIPAVHMPFVNAA